MVIVGEMEKWPAGESHIRYLGRLMVLLHTLEISLRFFIGLQKGESFSGLPKGISPYDFNLGDEVPASEFTSFESLRDLIKTFNCKSSENNSPTIDEEIIELRNAIAHGCVSGVGNSSVLQLIKFSSPKNGKVVVQYKATMDSSWFEAQIKKVNGAAHLVCSELAATNKRLQSDAQART